MGMQRGYANHQNSDHRDNHAYCQFLTVVGYPWFQNTKKVASEYRLEWRKAAVQKTNSSEAGGAFGGTLVRARDAPTMGLLTDGDGETRF